MYLRRLTLTGFRSYEQLELDFEPGVTTLVGRNGQGKTNLVEAVGYLATLGSHRVATDHPLIRAGDEQAVVRAVVVRDGRDQSIEIEINPGRANRARLGRGAAVRPRDILGSLRTVLFAPEDLALVKGDPAGRRRFLDDLLVARQPRWAAARSDYDKILKQRNALLKNARTSRNDAALADSLPVWDTHLAATGANLTYARLRLLRDLAPYVGQAYDQVSDSVSGARIDYQTSLPGLAPVPSGDGAVPTVEEITAAMHAGFAEQRSREVERGITLVGPHRDDLELTLGELPAKGYASHGESWSFALALRLAGYQLLRADVATDPVLVLDDVFAELDVGRRTRLAALISDCEQVLITAAVRDDVPPDLAGRLYDVRRGAVTVPPPDPSASAATAPTTDEVESDPSDATPTRAIS
ncbi:DNA replication/repair protein RecF [Allobranchiibius sp. CTAmp26]|uniref:DNA replication/repair protein RecF n=1 Tax=Allobranchiibius sp. CTAmp26 TaxID=2815214 RepID=UPI001AA14817|nr:DNA replication/repair protein RecF [Allobranchiibius sp. CTAmp26]MBO1756251.1 DNA replication/repair protein RecF [Allobranchiibius sp. CTAmp26]